LEAGLKEVQAEFKIPAPLNLTIRDRSDMQRSPRLDVILHQDQFTVLLDVYKGNPEGFFKAFFQGIESFQQRDRPGAPAIVTLADPSHDGRIDPNNSRDVSHPFPGK